VILNVVLGKLQYDGILIRLGGCVWSENLKLMLYMLVDGPGGGGGGGGGRGPAGGGGGGVFAPNVVFCVLYGCKCKQRLRS